VDNSHSNPHDGNPVGVRQSLLRLSAAGVIVAVAVVGLWQAGVLFQPDEGHVQSGAETISLAPADTGIETPNPRGLTVGLREGDLAPDFEFSAFDGRRMKLSDFRGRAVFINFWATWCAPCRVEMPDIQTVLEDHVADGLVVIGVNNGEALAPAQRFLNNLDMRWTAFAYDPGQDIVRRYGIYGMPTSFFIDAEGVITRVHSGQLSLRIMQSAVSEAIAGAASLRN
jgi:thiol-disulfide isomerase/thioredoxin